jgi:hypothetical protein
MLNKQKMEVNAKLVSDAIHQDLLRKYKEIFNQEMARSFVHNYNINTK